MHDVEREIIKITKYKVQRKFDDRQDYLRSVLLAVQNLGDAQFDKMSDEAAEWANACVEIENTRRGADLPDFDEVDPPTEPDEVIENEDEDESDEGDDDDSSDDDADDTDADDDEAEVESDEDEDPEDEDEAPTSEDGEADLTGHEDDPDLEDEPEEEPEEPAPTPKNPKAVKKPKPEKKAKAPKIPPKEPKLKDPEKRAFPGHVNLELDKWGCIVGSKNSQALAMFEKGATSGEIKNSIGGTYYNTLKKQIDNGHRLERYGAVTKLIHKDDFSSPKKLKKK